MDKKQENMGFLIETAEIVAVGTELLIGQTMNSNAHYLAGQLTLLGINSYYQTVVGDNPDRLSETLARALTRADLVITSGGLGPTADDITMQYSAKLAGKELVLDPDSEARIAEYFLSSNRTPSANNWKQAMLPEGAYIMTNNNGTAPGAIMTFSYQGQTKAIACLPGPPSELKPMFEEHLAPWLKARTKYTFKHRFLHLIGIGESDAEMKVRDLIDGQKNPTLAPYASPGEVCFRLTQRFDRSEPEADRLGELADEVYRRLGQYVYEDGKRSLPQVVYDRLKSRGETVSFAESCTAGLISSQFGQIPGVSEVYQGAVVSYSNRVKVEVLGVDPQILATEGAVSEACALAMARGVAEKLNTDLGISVTGIAGPSGGSPDKPVGTVYVAAVYKGKAMVKKHLIKGNREKVRLVAALRAYHIGLEILQA